MAILTNLYPPIVETYMPAFVASGGVCRVYFALSQHTKITDIKGIQVVVRDQHTNLSMLDRNRYPSEIMLKSGQLLVDEDIKTDYRYYIEIENADIQNGFQPDRYYKVQLRFSDLAYNKTGFPQAADGWLNTNLLHFSEWSTVTLIRGIPRPQLTILGFEEGQNELNWSIDKTQVIGKLAFLNDEREEVETQEVLRSYQITLQLADGTSLVESQELYDNISDNTFTYTLKYSLDANKSYKLIVTYVTSNLYRETIKYPFNVSPQSSLSLDLVVSGEQDPENARIKLTVQKGNPDQVYSGRLVIRRSSSKTNFTFWEDIYTRRFKDAHTIDFTWYDYTVESGVLYDYAVQGIEDNSSRGQMMRFLDPTMVEFDHIFLTGTDRQLKVEYNPKVSSLKQNLLESKIDTIGAKYPFIRRNGKTQYMEFPISGLISSESDPDNLFTSKEEVYGKSKDYYDSYNDKNKIGTSNDLIYEKNFRDKVQDFLYDGKVKIFRSPTEGAFLVRLMDISFTPFEALGRRLWSFSATAHQVDDFNEEALKKYGFTIEEND